MDNLESYFAKISQLTKNHQEKLDSIIETVFKSSGVKLSPNQIIERGGKVVLQVSPLIKNQIYLKKDLILKELKSILNRRSPKDLN